MSKTYEVSAGQLGQVYGVYLAETEQGARDDCARDAGYASEAQMVETLERESGLVARELSATEILSLQAAAIERDPHGPNAFMRLLGVDVAWVA